MFRKPGIAHPHPVCSLDPMLERIWHLLTADPQTVGLYVTTMILLVWNMLQQRHLNLIDRQREHGEVRFDVRIVSAREIRITYREDVVPLYGVHVIGRNARLFDLRISMLHPGQTEILPLAAGHMTGEPSDNLILCRRDRIHHRSAQAHWVGADVDHPVHEAR